MKLSLDPMPAYRNGAVVKVNSYYANLASLAAMQEAAWKRKRDLARAVDVGDWAGGALMQEAELRGLTVQALADLILSKPDPAQLADARELHRQRALLAIDAAQTPSELDNIIAGLK